MNGKVDVSINSIKDKYDTVENVDESSTTLVSNRPNKITQRQKKNSKVIIYKDNLHVSILTGLG